MNLYLGSFMIVSVTGQCLVEMYPHSFEICLLIFLLVVSWLPRYRAEYEDIKLKRGILRPQFHMPFAVVWNVNNSNCGISDILDKYGILHNSGLLYKSSDIIALYYERAFHYFPKYDQSHKDWVNGGLPQNASDNALMADFAGTIQNLPQGFHGLGVLDWESWRALYDRMNKTVYQDESLKFVRRQFPNLTDKQVLAIAKYQYNSATRKLMQEVLEVGKILQPDGRWGFYLYPDCRYYDYAKNNYSCTDNERKRNDEIQWLFDSSTALFPSVYLGQDMKSEIYTVQYVSGRILEALRLERNRPSELSIPVYSYHMLSYKKSFEFLDLNDLLNSIGVATYLGGSGAIIWGSAKYTETQAKCDSLRTYVDNTLGPLCMKMMQYALKCSKDFCNSNGRCVITRKDHEGDFRFLSQSEMVSFMQRYGYNDDVFQMTLKGSSGIDDPSVSCHCFDGWHGEHCTLSD